MGTRCHGAGAVLDSAVPVPAVGPGNVKLENHVNPGGRIGLEAGTHAVKDCLHIASGLVARCFFSRP